MLGAKFSKLQLSKDIKKQIAKNATPIVSSAVTHAINNLLNEPVLSSMYNIKKWTSLNQGSNDILI